MTDEPSREPNRPGLPSLSELSDGSLLRAMPGLIRIAASSGWRVLEWSVSNTVNTTNQVAKAVAAGESPTQAIQEATSDLRSMVQQALGMNDQSSARTRQSGATVEELRARGAELLSLSADVWLDEETHPAYQRILEELAPDEARILRFLALEGPQPSIDVRTGRPLGIGSEMVASGLSMIGLHAGLRNLDRTNAYLNNLYRLGLIWFSREQVDDPGRYQVVEAQPDVTDAMKQAGRGGKTVRRSIHLTPFGEDFCWTCLPLDNGTETTT